MNGSLPSTWGFLAKSRADRIARSTKIARGQRRGTVLVLVLVVTGLLALGAYTFAEYMIVEDRAVLQYARGLQARAAADSGAEMAAAILEDRESRGASTVYQNTAAFQAVALQSTGTSSAGTQSSGGRPTARFSVIAPSEIDDTGRTFRFGLIDESSKINLNWLAKQPPSDEVVRKWLYYIPNMTPEITDAMLDFIDSDQSNRQAGAESNYYQSLSPSYSAKDGPLTSLDELLLVRGVTAELLYGEDANRNGLLDPNENDGSASAPYDNADGILDAGFSAYLTVVAKEANTQKTGEDRINVNMAALADLYDKLEPELGGEIAKFVIAYRAFGPKQTNTGTGASPAAGSSTGTGSGNTSGTGTGTGSGSGTSTGTNTGSGSSTGSSRTGTGTSTGSGTGTTTGTGTGTGTGSGGSSLTQQTQQIQQTAVAVNQASNTGSGAVVTRAGINITNGGATQITSLFDLVGTEVAATVEGQPVTLKSPWAAEAADMNNRMPQLFDLLTTRSDPLVEGRINAAQARRETLLGIPNMTVQIVDTIMSRQQSSFTDGSSSNTSRATPAWLFTEGCMDMDTLRKVAPSLAPNGDVFRGQVVGYFESGGGSARIEAIFDATESPVRIVSMRDLSELGRGFAVSQLLGSATKSGGGNP